MYVQGKRNKQAVDLKFVLPTASWPVWYDQDTVFIKLNQDLCLFIFMLFFSILKCSNKMISNFESLTQ